MSKIIVDISNKKFGKLTAIELAFTKPVYGAYWKCLCECGNTAFVAYKNLKNNQTKSCGCMRFKNHGTRLPPGESACNYLFNSYLRGATRRNYEFTLTKEEFKILTKSNCHYCNIEPSRSFCPTNRNGAYICNGIDRKDNSKGYTSDNCVACCKACNFAKRSTSYEDFMNWTKRFKFVK